MAVTPHLPSIARWALAFLWSAFWITVALLASAVARSRRPGLTLARGVWAPGILRLVEVRCEVVRRPSSPLEGPFLVAANHRSLLDIPALFAALPMPIGFAAKGELRRFPFLGRYMRSMGMVFLERGRGRRNVAVVQRVAELLAAGQTLVCFPEGHRQPLGRIARFQSGVLSAALEAGVPVLPVAIAGSGEALPPRTLRARPGTIRLAIGQPIEVGPFEDRRALARAVEEEVRRLSEEIDAPSSGPASQVSRET